jgi:hypothetical protein
MMFIFLDFRMGSDTISLASRRRTVHCGRFEEVCVNFVG